MGKLFMTDDELKHCVFVEKMITKNIASKFRIHPSSVRERLVKVGIGKNPNLERPSIKELISNDRLKEIYTQDNLTMSQVGERLGVGQSAVSKYMKKIGIKSIKGQKQFLVAKAVALTQMQKEYLVGCLLGDGFSRRTKNEKHCHFSVTHCMKQEEYLIWQYNLMSPIARDLKYNRAGDPGVVYPNCGFYTLSHSDISLIHDMFYDKDHVKGISEKLYEYLTPFSLSVWWADDGTKKGTLATHCFTYKENSLLQFMLHKKFGLLPEIRVDDEYATLWFSSEERVKLSKIIVPYTVECMKYKLTMEVIRGNNFDKRDIVANLPEEEIKQLYLYEKWSRAMIGAEYGVSDSSIGRLLDRVGINSRPIGSYKNKK